MNDEDIDWAMTAQRVLTLRCMICNEPAYRMKPKL